MGDAASASRCCRRGGCRSVKACRQALHFALAMPLMPTVLALSNREMPWIATSIRAERPEGCIRQARVIFPVFLARREYTSAVCERNPSRSRPLQLINSPDNQLAMSRGRTAEKFWHARIRYNAWARSTLSTVPRFHRHVSLCPRCRSTVSSCSCRIIWIKLRCFSTGQKLFFREAGSLF